MDDLITPNFRIMQPREVLDDYGRYVPILQMLASETLPGDPHGIRFHATYSVGRERRSVTENIDIEHMNRETMLNAQLELVRKLFLDMYSH